MKPNTDRDERVRQIRERLALHRQEAEKYRNRVWADKCGLDYNEAPDDVDYLLSLLDSQAADSETLRDARYATKGYRTGFNDAATRMRDRCVAKVRELRDGWRARIGNSNDPTFKIHYQTRFDAAEEIRDALESLTLEQEK